MSEESRRVAEALGPDRDARARAVRERGMWAAEAVAAADVLITELDRRRAAELEEARS